MAQAKNKKGKCSVSARYLQNVGSWQVFCSSLVGTAYLWYSNLRSPELCNMRVPGGGILLLSLALVLGFVSSLCYGQNVLYVTNSTEKFHHEGKGCPQQWPCTLEVALNEAEEGGILK